MSNNRKKYTKMQEKLSRQRDANEMLNPSKRPIKSKPTRPRPLPSPSNQQSRDLTEGYTIDYGVPFDGFTTLVDSNNNVVHEWSDIPGGDFGMSYNINIYPNLDVLSDGTWGRPLIMYNSMGDKIWELDINDSPWWDIHSPGKDLVVHHDTWIMEDPDDGSHLILIGGSHEASVWGRYNYGDDVPGYGMYDDNNPSYMDLGFIQIIKPTGINGESSNYDAELIFEWYMEDHIISALNGDDITDPTKININLPSSTHSDAPTRFDTEEFMHHNTIHYDPIRNNVIITSRNIGEGEFFVVSIATGEIVYRCCNPQNYGRGDENDRKTNGLHGANVIPHTYVNGGDIIWFNNEGPVGQQQISEVIKITPNYEAFPHGDFDSNQNLQVIDIFDWSVSGGGAFGLPNGNIFVSPGQGADGYEVTDPWTNPEIIQTISVNNPAMRRIKYVCGSEQPDGYMYRVDIPDCGYQLGDVNNDGLLNVLDVVQLVNYILDLADFSDLSQAAADITQDGSIDILDIVTLVNQILMSRDISSSDRRLLQEQLDRLGGVRPKPLEPITSQEEPPYDYFITIEGKSLSQKYVELKKINRGDRTDRLNQHVNQLINTKNSVESEIKKIKSNMNIISRPFKAINGIFVEDLSERDIQSIKLLNGVVNVVKAFKPELHLNEVIGGRLHEPFYVPGFGIGSYDEEMSESPYALNYYDLATDSVYDLGWKYWIHDVDIGIRDLWDWSGPCCTGQGVNIGIIDDGIDENHSVFSNTDFGEMLDFSNSTSGDYGAEHDDNVGHGTGTASIIVGDPGTWEDHGWLWQFIPDDVPEEYLTGQFDAFTGVAPDATLHVYKIFPGGQPASIAGIERTMDPNGNCGDDLLSLSVTDFCFEDHLDVVNNSWGGPGYPLSDPESIAAGAAVDVGVTMVFSAGNAGPGAPTNSSWQSYVLPGNPADGYQTVGCPGCNPKVITVGATKKYSPLWSDGGTTGGTLDGTIASYSSRGPTWPIYDGSEETYDKPDIVAVGGDSFNPLHIAASRNRVFDTIANPSTWGVSDDEVNHLNSIYYGPTLTDSNYENYWDIWFRKDSNAVGTSYAAPIVTGLIALIFERHEEFKGCPPLIKHILMESTWNVPGNPWLEDVGAGNIDPHEAMWLADNISYSFSDCDDWITENVVDPPGEQYGCTDPLALNYDPNADFDDGSCYYEFIDDPVIPGDGDCWGYTKVAGEVWNTDTLGNLVQVPCVGCRYKYYATGQYAGNVYDCEGTWHPDGCGDCVGCYGDDDNCACDPAEGPCNDGLCDGIEDECGVCDGDNSTCLDCTGVPNGDSFIDECGVCNGDGFPCGVCDEETEVELWGECYNIESTTEVDLSSYLSDNQLTGEIPSEIGNLTNLTFLDLGYNQLSGEIPLEIGNLINLTILYLHGNQLTGEIPPEIGNLTNLTELFLSSNQLTELPPEIRYLTNLTNLLLAGNQLTELPPEIGNLTNLTSLNLLNNQLTGEILPEIGNLTNLAHLRLQNNQLTGEIPYQLGNLTNLNKIELENNQLTGIIHQHVCDLFESNNNWWDSWNFNRNIIDGNNFYNQPLEWNIISSWDPCGTCEDLTFSDGSSWHDDYTDGTHDCNWYAHIDTNADGEPVDSCNGQCSTPTGNYGIWPATYFYCTRSDCWGDCCPVEGLTANEACCGCDGGTRPDISCGLDSHCPENEYCNQDIGMCVPDSSCEGYCGGHGIGCFCDEQCVEMGDCCTDFDLACTDCDGVLLGSAEYDCAGDCGGDSVVDDCGVCGGNGSSCGGDPTYNCEKFCGSNPTPAESAEWYNNYFQDFYNDQVSWSHACWGDSYNYGYDECSSTAPYRSPLWTAYFSNPYDILVYEQYYGLWQNGPNRLCGPGFAIFPATSTIYSAIWEYQQLAWVIGSAGWAQPECDNLSCGTCGPGTHCAISTSQSYCVSNSFTGGGGGGDTDDPYTDVETGGGGFNDPFGDDGPDLPVPGTCNCTMDGNSYQCHTGVNNCNPGFEPVCDIYECDDIEPGDSEWGDAQCAPGNENNCDEMYNNVSGYCIWNPNNNGGTCEFWGPPSPDCCGIHPNCNCQSIGLLSSGNVKKHFTNGVFDRDGNEWEDSNMLNVFNSRGSYRISGDKDDPEFDGFHAE